ncbi:YrdB family protein [Micromonospora sp. NPDC050686]|uniref:YrdB family protein n=1 Tax=Micromonospora sp. NPDC050686 TaxID=3154631 RepID=UPI003411954C
MKVILLALAFLLELALLVAAGWWGFTLDAGRPVRLLAGLGAPLLIAVVWGLFCSPRATVALPAPAKLAAQAACFVTGAVLLALAGRPAPAVLLVALWAVDKTLLRVAGDPV